MMPRATYRLQFHKEFGFDKAADLASYLASLGVSHIYASPWLKARPGSLHGYDIVDHHALNPELGDLAAFDRMVSAARANALGQILDFVPNHMGVGGGDNPLWLEMLEWGPDSGHAGWFDIDWGMDRTYLHNKVLVPVLADQYGVELEAGKLILQFDECEGSFAVWAYETHKLPVCPLHYARILDNNHAELERIGDDFSSLQEWRPQVVRRASELKAQLARRWHEDKGVRSAIEEATRWFNGTPGQEKTWQRLRALIQIQYWRAADFRVAADDINYRRFFNVNELAGIRMELPDVFDHAHELVIRLLENGTLDGLRIDHIDGLLDPKEYLERLRASTQDSETAKPFYLVVEKILAHHENLREDWPVQGTTGYEFANAVLGLLIDPAGEEGLTQTYLNFSGVKQGFDEIVRNSKLRIMKNEMASELNMLAREAARVARSHPKTADFTQNILRRAIREVVACFPVYRTYVDTRGPATEEDFRYLDWAIKQAQTNKVDVDARVFNFLMKLLSGELVARGQSGFSRHAVLRFAMKLQQYSGPVMAKGLEDTAFYRYNRYVALNEVGGDPNHFGHSLASFHKANLHQAKSWPDSMLTTSTHDTKRGEDARARLAVLSEMPDEWARQVHAWSKILRARRADIEATGPPDRNDEYLFYQLLVGTWPTELMDIEALDAACLESYRERIKGAMLKSMREAKTYTTWEAPNKDYEDAVLAYVADALCPERSRTFLAAFLPFQNRIAELGMLNSLVQTTLKLTVPGVPDIYQGAELWDLSLADPDNRRPIDFSRRIQMLQLLDASAARGELSIEGLKEKWRDGSIKLYITSAILRFRRDNAELFSKGDYEVLHATGTKADNICAFSRRLGDSRIIVAASRFPSQLICSCSWSDTAIPLPIGADSVRWKNVLTGAVLNATNRELSAGMTFSELPVAIFSPVLRLN
jgi:(1->4)-alpha-D-glucan 1-alpha-D-glucosylmutase